MRAQGKNKLSRRVLWMMSSHRCLQNTPRASAAVCCCSHVLGAPTSIIVFLPAMTTINSAPLPVLLMRFGWHRMVSVSNINISAPPVCFQLLQALGLGASIMFLPTITTSLAQQRKQDPRQARPVGLVAPQRGLTKKQAKTTTTTTTTATTTTTTTGKGNSNSSDNINTGSAKANDNNACHLKPQR